MADNEWIYDFVIAYLKSPPWRCPLNNFIDEHCVKFSDDEENKLEYTTIHQEFCNLIDKLLGGYLKELGLSEEEFVAAVQASSSENDKVNKLIFGQILAVDNFLTFKKMMVKRSKALEVKAMKMVADPKASQKKTKTDDDDADVSAMTEEEQLALALKLSAQLAVTANNRTQDAMDKLEKALKASILESDVMKSTLEKEQAELEHAIALSLAMEQERLKKIQAAEEEEKTATSAPAKAAAKEKKEKLIAEEAKIIAQEEADAKGVTRPNTASVAASPLPTIAVLEKRHMDHKKQVEQEFTKSEKTKREKKKKEKKAREEAKVNDDELKKRQEFLNAQKELIKAKRLAQREEELKEYNQENKQGIPPPATTAKEPKPVEVAPMTAEEEKQQAMRRALAQRFKKDMMVRKERIQAEKTDEYSSLSAQLKQSEMLRQKMDQTNAAEIAEQERNRAMQMEKFHKNLAQKRADAANADFT